MILLELNTVHCFVRNVFASRSLIIKTRITIYKALVVTFETKLTESIRAKKQFDTFTVFSR